MACSVRQGLYRGFPKLGVPFWRLHRGSIAVYGDIWGLGIRVWGLPKLGVPFWGSPY